MIDSDIVWFQGRMYFLKQELHVTREKNPIIIFEHILERLYLLALYLKEIVQTLQFSDHSHSPRMSLHISSWIE